MSATASYARSDDDVTMVAIAPHVFVNGSLLARLKLRPFAVEPAVASAPAAASPRRSSKRRVDPVHVDTSAH